MNLLKILFGNLTKTGVEQPEGQQTFYNDPSQAGVALAKILSRTAQPQTSDISGPISAPGDVQAIGQDYAAPPAGGIGPPQDPNTQYGYDPSADPSPTFHSPGSAGLLPHIFKPSFREASVDSAGNAKGISPGLTKGGTLLSILRTIAQGGADAIAGGALDAPRNGESPFGTGFQAAMQMPWLRAQRQQALQRQQQEDQIRQDEISSLPSRRAQRDAQASATLAGTRATTALHQAQTTKALQGPASKDSLQEQRQNFADEHSDMFTDTNEKKNFVLYGAQPKAATKNPNEWQLRIDAANGDEDAQDALDQRFSERKTLTRMRHTSNRASNKESEAQDAADAEGIASKIMNSSNGDPDKALTLFDQHSPSVTDPRQRKLGPLIRKALRGRKRVNPAPKPMSELDRLLAQP